MYKVLNDFAVLCAGNVDVIFFFYGLAFIILGIVIILQLRITRRSEFAIFKPLWLLAWFGLTHGANEFLDMFMIIKKEHAFLHFLSPPLLVLSYLFIMWFGIRMINLGKKKIIGFSLPLAAALAFFAAPAFLGIRSVEVWQISARYFIGFPGALLSALGLIIYYQNEKEKLSQMEKSIKFYFFTAALCFAVYAFLGGLVVPPANFFPASIINNASFHAVVRLPVQLFRGLCAIIIAWSVAFITNIFNIEANRELMISEEKYRKLVDNALVGVFKSNPRGEVLYANEAAAKIFESESIAELITDGIFKRYKNPKDREKVLEILKKDGQVSNYEITMVTRSGKTRYLLATAALEGDEISGMLIDITDRKRMENELQGKIEEMKIIVDAAVGRELKMMEREQEINALLKELGREAKYK